MEELIHSTKGGRALVGVVNLNQPTWTTNANKPLVEMILFWIWIRFLVIFVEWWTDQYPEMLINCVFFLLEEMPMAS